MTGPEPQPRDPRALCREYGYPEQIGEQLARIREALRPLPDESLILLGSTSRGEFSHLLDNDRFYPLSDYEFLLVSPGPPDADETARRAAELAALEQEFSSGSPLFHIDISPISPAALRRLPRIIRHYETRERGVVLSGPDRRGDLPEVSLRNLVFEDVNEILIWRLWSLLLYFPLGTPPREEPTLEDRTYNYMVCRNGLDLTTWLLPWEGRLIPSFRERLAFLEDRGADLPLAARLGNELPPYLRRCAEGKFRVRFDRPWTENYVDTIEILGHAGRLVVEGLKLPTESARSGRAGFDDWNARRKAHELRSLWRGEWKRGLFAWPGWLLRGKFTAVFLALGALHRSMTAHLTGREDPLRELLEAGSILGRIEPADGSSATSGGEGFVGQWGRERRRLAEFMMFYFPSLNAKRAHVLRTLGSGPGGSL